MSKVWNKWERLDLLVKALSGILLPLAIASIGYFGHKFLQSRQSNEAKLRLYTELISQREESDSALRKDMLNRIIDSFLTTKSYSLEEKVVELELMAHNFHESIDLKPLFKHLRKRIISMKRIMRETGSGSKQGDDNGGRGYSVEDLDNYLERVENVARRIANKQMVILEAVGKIAIGHVDLEMFGNNPENEFPVFAFEKELTIDRTKTGFKLDVLRVDKEAKEIEVQLAVTHYKADLPNMQIYEFSIGFFDFPSVDNIRLPNDQRCALVLSEFDARLNGAIITLVYFPGSYASLKEKPYYEEVIEKLGKAL